MKLPLGPWRPDIVENNAGVLELALSALPGRKSWGPAPSLQPVSDALTGTPRGCFTAIKEDGSVATIVGTDTKLYIRSGETFTDATRLVGGDYTVASGHLWRFTQFGTKVVAVHPSDDPQVIDIETDANFADLGGTPPQAGQVTVIDDYLVLSELTDTPNSIIWSDTNDITNWSTGNSDMQEFADGGPVKGFFPAAKLVVQEGRVRRLIVTGDTDVFQFDEVESTINVGTICSYGIVELGSALALYTDTGFKIVTASEVREIGKDNVDEWFKGEMFSGRSRMIQGVRDPGATRVYWAFPTEESDLFASIVGYDWTAWEGQGGFFQIDEPVYVLGTSAEDGTSLEELDDVSASLDALAQSLDAQIWQGGRPTLAAIGEDKRIGYLNGGALQAVLRGSLYTLIEGVRSFVNQVTGETDAATYSIRVNRKQRRSGADNWTSASTVQMSGVCPVRASGKYHQFEATVPSQTWLTFEGLEANPQPDGMR